MDMNDKLRPFLIAKILQERTDEEHTLTTNEICQILQEEYGIETFRTTVKADVELLQRVGVGIQGIRSTQNRYNFIDRTFDTAELKILIDAVQSAKFISKTKSDQLTEKLYKLAGSYKAAELKRNLVVDGRYKAAGEQILLIVDAINEAINQGVKIRFQMTEYDAQKAQVLHNDGETYTFSPYSLVWDGDFYYMVGWSEKYRSVGSHRVDRIARVPEVTSEPAVAPPAGFDINQYINTMFRMYDAPRAEVKLVVDEGLMDAMIDKFGPDVATEPLLFGRFRLKATVSVGTPFFNWVFGFGGRVQIVGPAEVREEYEARVRAALAEDDVPQATLIEDVLDCSHTVRVLHKAGVYTMEELATMTYDDLLQLRGIGKVIATDVTEQIKMFQEQKER